MLRDKRPINYSLLLFSTVCASQRVQFYPTSRILTVRQTENKPQNSSPFKM